MQRLLSIVLVFGVLAATAAAFAVTEGLKLTKSPVTGVRIVAPDQLSRRVAMMRTFSPICDCRTGSVALKLRLRKADTLTLDVVDGRGERVRRLADAQTAHRGWNSFIWNGRTDDGRVAPHGAYRFKVGLEQARRTILLPNRIRLDTKPPSVLKATASRDVISPDGDGKADSLKIHYKLSERGHAVVFALGHQVVSTRSAKTSASLFWYGKVDGRPLPQGTYRLRVGAVDVAGNRSTEAAVVVVHVRYIWLARHSIPGVPAGVRFGVQVETGAPEYHWRLAGRRGVSSDALLVLRAPKKPGRYRLVVAENGHRDAAAVVVVPRP